MTWIARSLFRAGAARQVLAVHLPKSRSYMHLDTVITMCDRDLVTLFPQVVYGARTWAIRPGESAEDLVTEEQHGTLPELMARARPSGSVPDSREPWSYSEPGPDAGMRRPPLVMLGCDRKSLLSAAGG